MQFNVFHLFFFTLFFFISSVDSAPSHSEQDIEALMGLQDKVNEYLGSSNLNAAEKKKIEDMMAHKQSEIEKSFGKKK
uniref:DUF148 domain-containing protein n=1 Tax=Caenorhabditis tropicalis TaxID=1561998 RepID=A0A1I7UXA0_9PELO